MWGSLFSVIFTRNKNLLNLVWLEWIVATKMFCDSAIKSNKSHSQCHRQQYWLIFIIPSQIPSKSIGGDIISKAAIHLWLGERMSGRVCQSHFTLWTWYRLQFLLLSIYFKTSQLGMMRGRTLLILGHGVNVVVFNGAQVFETSWSCNLFWT